MGRRECRLGKHVDRLLKGGKFVECTICHSRFPCDQLLCRHLDCRAERAEPGSIIVNELGFDK